MVNIPAEQQSGGTCSSNVIEVARNEKQVGRDTANTREETLVDRSRIIIDYSQGSLRIEVDGEVHSNPGITPDTAELVIRPEFTNFRSDLQSAIGGQTDRVRNKITEQLPPGTQFALDQFAPDPAERLRSEFESLGAVRRSVSDNIEPTEGGNFRITFSEDVTPPVPQITVPAINEERANELRQKLNDVGATVSVTATITDVTRQSLDFRFGRSGSGGDIDAPTVTADIPFCTFIQVETVGALSCEKLIGKAESEVSKWEARVNTKLASAEATAEELVGIRDEIISISGMSPNPVSIVDECEGPSSFENVQTPDINVSAFTPDGGLTQLREMEFGDLTGTERTELGRLRTEAEGINTDFSIAGDSIAAAKRELNNLKDQMPDIRQECVSPLIDRIEEALSQLDKLQCIQDRLSNLKNEILDELPEDIGSLDCFNEIPNSLDSDIDDFERKVRSLPSNPDKSDITNLKSTRDRLKERVRNEAPEVCVEEVMAPIDDAASEIPDIPEVETQAFTDCANAIGGGIKRTVGRYEGDVTSFTARSITNREEPKRQRLLERGKRIKGRLNSMDVPERCVSGLRSRVNTAMSQLRQAGSRQTAAISCRDRYPDIAASVESIEDLATSLQPPISNNTVQNIASQAESLADDIQTSIPAGSECRQEFSQRVKSSLETVRQSKSSITIVTAGQTATEAEQEETIAGLQEKTEERVRVLESTFQEL